MRMWPDGARPGGTVARWENGPEPVLAERGFQPSAASWPGHAGPGAQWPDRPSPPRWADRGPGRRPRLRPAVVLSGVVLSVLLAGVVTGYLLLDGRLTRVAALAAYQGRPAPSGGQNWLITGSDSRQGLSRQQEKQLSLGHDVSGRRSDTIMLLHVPGGAQATLVSLPRDSEVPISGHGPNKLNAAFSYGGPALLARTVQNVTPPAMRTVTVPLAGGQRTRAGDVPRWNQAAAHRLFSALARS